MRNLWWAAVMTLTLSSCASKPCKELTQKVCEAAPGSRACEASGRLTAPDECLGYLSNVARYVELVNEEVKTPTRRPPTPEAAPAAEPAAQVPAPEAAPAAPAAEASPSAATPTP